MVHALWCGADQSVDRRGQPRHLREHRRVSRKKHGYVLDFAYDGVSAMRLALTNPFDVIVLDLMLPGWMA